MEELRSTEILDKEIEADARKKAEKLLLNADAECQKLLDGVQERVAGAECEKKQYYAGKIAAFTANLDAALPLEKERFLASFYAEAVGKALNDYLTALGEEEHKLIESITGKKDRKHQKINLIGGRIRDYHGDRTYYVNRKA